MNYPDEILMAYADGALQEPKRSEVERAVRADPTLAAIVERHRAQRREVVTAFAGVLNEPAPSHPQPAAPGKVLSFEAARSARARDAAPPAAPAPQRSAWPRWGALTAALVLGVLAGSLWFDGSSGDGSMVTADAHGRLVARGQLAGALWRQLASDPAPTSPVRMGVSFASRDGGYCRSFRVGASAGLACRDGDTWRIPVLSETRAARGEDRQAAGATPEAVLDAIDERITGTALNAAAERTARTRGWKR
ncbi:anti-sigma factor family protein [Massilia sp. CMS3.1]|uniref:anti-sigma factor family protein n=1 Tax=Massilia sp. CMS3.1 TaxID=3373083 RepID=UPI003EE730C1